MPTSHSHLHGLNVVQPDSPDAGTGTQHDLLSGHHFPDLAAQLDLWSTLNFQSDEPLLDEHGHPLRQGHTATPSSLDDKEEEEIEGPASLDSHVNAVNPAVTTNASAHASSSTSSLTTNPQHLAAQFSLNGNGSNVDLNSILASFGIDPYLVPQLPVPPPNAQTAATASLAQLLSAYPFAGPPFLPHDSTVPPHALTQPGVTPSAQQIAAPTSALEAKKSRTKKSLVTKEDDVDLSASYPPSPTSPTSSLPPATPSASIAPGELSQKESNGKDTLNAAEDKRRRNTAASARFRMKKKEREAALEKRAAELEVRVNALERECEGLRRENGWLKGLVVGVTGASQGTVVAAGSPTGSPSPTIAQGPVGKRKRDEVETA